MRQRGCAAPLLGFARAGLVLLLLGSALAACKQSQPSAQPSVGDMLTQIMGRSLAPPAEAPAAVAKPEPIRIKPGGEGSSEPAKQVYYGSTTRVTPTPAAAELPPAGEDVRLNFENAPLREVVRLVMTDTLHLNYEIDPRVQGNVTISTVNPIARANLLALLDSVLRMNGAALVRGGVGYRIVPLAEASGPAVVAPIGGTSEPIPAGYGLSIVPLRFISAQNIGEILGPLKGLPGLVRIDTARNLLIVAGDRNERQNLVDTIRSFDVDWLHDKSIGIFPLKHANPASVIAELETMLGGGLAATGSAAEQAAQAAAAATLPEGAPPSVNVAAGAAPPLKGVVKLLPIVRLNAVLVVSENPQLLREVDQWIARLDRDSSAGASLYVYYLKNGKAATIARMLNQVFGLQGARTEAAAGRVAPGRTPVAVGGGTAVAGASASTLGASGVGTVAGLGSVSSAGSNLGVQRAASASAIEGARETVGAPEPGFANVRVIPDEVSNALLILAMPDTYKMIEQAIRQIDVPALQVLIEATIAEVTLNTELRYGLQFYFKHFNQGVGPAASTILTDASTSSIGSTLPGFSFLLGSSGPSVILDALSSKTTVNVVSSPHLVVQDNQEALLQVGDVVPVTVQQAVSTAESNAPIVNSIQYVNTGVILHVTPRINVGGAVSLDIEQEVSSVSTSASTGTLTPTISERRIDSTVSVESGQTIVLGGLISDSRSGTKSGIPLISDIPLVGNLAGTTDNTVAKTELIVFITPHVIRDSAEAERVSEELRAKILGATPQQK